MPLIKNCPNGCTGGRHKPNCDQKRKSSPRGGGWTPDKFRDSIKTRPTHELNQFLQVILDEKTRRRELVRQKYEAELGELGEDIQESHRKPSYLQTSASEPLPTSAPSIKSNNTLDAFIPSNMPEKPLPAHCGSRHPDDNRVYCTQEVFGNQGHDGLCKNKYVKGVTWFKGQKPAIPKDGFNRLSNHK